MSVYIKGMEMPTSCSVCELCGCYNETKGEVYRCDITMHPVKFFGTRLDNCPLIPVPDHGRLIDADALLSKDYQIYRLDGAAAGRRNLSFYDIQEAPTIIPADKEGEG